MDGIDKLTRVDVDVIMAYAECGMRLSTAAKAIHYAKMTIEYHLTSVYQKTGLNPKKFYDLVELIRLINEKTANEQQGE